MLYLEKPLRIITMRIRGGEGCEKRRGVKTTTKRRRTMNVMVGGNGMGIRGGRRRRRDQLSDREAGA